MHQQIKTSPGHTDENLRMVIDALAAAGVNIEGIGPDFESPHIRTMVPDHNLEDAWTALEAAGLKPILCPAVTYAVENQPGAVRGILRDLARKGYVVESMLVLASRAESKTLVSFGVRQGIPPDWESTYEELGGWEEPDDWSGGDVSSQP